jgi:hypothetical protein
MQLHLVSRKLVGTKCNCMKCCASCGKQNAIAGSLPQVVGNKMQLTEDPKTPVCNQMQFALIQNKIPKENSSGIILLS